MFARIRRIPFRERLVIGGVLMLVVLEAASDAASIARERQRLDLQLHMRADLAADLLAESVVLPMWDFNEPVLQRMVEGLSADPTVAEATLRDEGGEVVAEWARRGASREGVVVARDVIYADVGTAQTIGDLEVRFSPAEADRQFRSFVLSELGSTLLLLLTATLGLRLVLGRIARPLEHLVQARSGPAASRRPCRGASGRTRSARSPRRSISSGRPRSRFERCARSAMPRPSASGTGWCARSSRPRTGSPCSTGTAAS